MKFTVNDAQPDMLRVIRLKGHIAELVAVIPIQPTGILDPATGRSYAEEIAEALQRRFGTPELDPADKARTFAGIPIPPALDEVAHLLAQAEGKEAYQRTPQQNDAVRRFLAYCDAEGIELPRRGQN